MPKEEKTPFNYGLFYSKLYYKIKKNYFCYFTNTIYCGNIFEVQKAKFFNFGTAMPQECIYIICILPLSPAYYRNKWGYISRKTLPSAMLGGFFMKGEWGFGTVQGRFNG